MRDGQELNVCDPDHDDPILAELRQIRREFSEMFNGDVDAMARYIQEEERKLPPQRFSSRRPIRVNGIGADNESRGG